MHDLPAADRLRVLLVISGVASFGVILWIVCRPWDLENAFLIGAHVGRDFANFWLGGRLAIAGKLDLLINVAAYNELFSKTFQHNPAEGFVYSYPPHSLLFVAPFAALPFVPAVYLWTAVNLLCIARSVQLLRDDWTLATTACLSPAALTMVIFGHFGGLLAILATFVLARSAQRPAAGGACLALASVKPQFALMLAILLLLTGRWRVVLWSIPATLALVALSVVVFGIKPWLNYVEWTVPFHAKLISDFLVGALRTVISPYAGLRLAGAPGWFAQIVQYAFSIVVMVKAANLCRCGPDARTMTVALLAVLAGLPYVNSYDLAIAAPVLTLALFARPPGPPLLPTWAGALLWLMPPFSIPFGLMEIPVVQPIFAVIVLMALFAQERSPRATFVPAPSP